MLLLLLLVCSHLGRVGGQLGLGVLGPGAGQGGSGGSLFSISLASAAAATASSAADAARPLYRQLGRAHERPVKVLQRPQCVLVGPEAHEAELAGAAVGGADDLGVGNDDL